MKNQKLFGLIGIVVIFAFISSLWINQYYEQENLELNIENISQNIKPQQIAKAESRAKTDFMAQLSHELRTPMSGILGMTELMKGHLNSDVALHYNDVVKQSGESLLVILNDILDSAKIEAEQLVIQLEPFCIILGHNQAVMVEEAQEELRLGNAALGLRSELGNFFGLSKLALSKIGLQQRRADQQ